MDPGPKDIPFIDYLFNIGLALIGGLVRFMREWQANYEQWALRRVFLEGTLNGLLAGFAALLTFLLLFSWKVDPFYSAFACGVMGHMGPEGIALLKDVLNNGLRSRNSPPAAKE